VKGFFLHQLDFAAELVDCPSAAHPCSRRIVRSFTAQNVAQLKPFERSPGQNDLIKMM